MASAGGGTINLAATGTANYALELPASSPDAHTAFRRTFKKLTHFAHANSLNSLQRFEEARSLLRKTMPVARRVLGDSNEITIRTRWVYAATLCNVTGATLDDRREAVATLEETVRTARRVLGGEHPLTVDIDASRRYLHECLRAREASRA